MLSVVALLSAASAHAADSPMPNVPAKPPQLPVTEDIPPARFEDPNKDKQVPPPAPANANPSGTSWAQDGPPPDPFGARLFTGNFLRTRQDGLNPDYVVMPGDRVMVNTWGAVELSNTFMVDAQGNIFLPNVGPIQVAGTKNSELTAKVKTGLMRVYARNFEVYTNLLSAKPVAVFVTGGVKRPGRYAGVPSDSVLFFLEEAGGIEPRLGSYRSITVLRGDQKLIELDLYDFLLRGSLPPVQFKDGDTVLVNPRGSVIEMRGDVTLPATLEFKPSVVSGTEALGVVPGAARATQVTIQGIRAGVPISRTLSVKEFRSFALQDGDSITLRGDGRPDTILVHLEGEFNGPSVLAVRRGSRLIDVLNYVSVDPALANPRAVHIRRASVAKAQKTAIDDALFRLERSSLLALSASQGEANIRVREAELTQKFVERARLIQPLGRVVTARDSQQRNVVLEADDVIVVPARTNVIRVGGEVMMTQAVMFRPNTRASDYITDSGGYTDRSDQDRVIVIRANAEVAVGSPSLPIYPGDEILVPPKVDTKILQNAVDVTQVIYQIAVSAAVVVAIL
ncbi:MAG TPA: polysaccharide biosynthesis/export family protein [Polyangiaceae bacterium]|nr:polysaccharide biosynthesis/export family protein [Polyangiaceae bacterium]